MVNCINVSLAKGKGGLGIRNLDLLNRALLGKWARRFAVKENSTWKVCISTKYDTDAGTLCFLEEVMIWAFGKLFLKRLASCNRTVS